MNIYIKRNLIIYAHYIGVRPAWSIFFPTPMEYHAHPTLGTTGLADRCRRHSLVCMQEVVPSSGLRYTH